MLFSRKEFEELSKTVIKGDLMKVTLGVDLVSEKNKILFESSLGIIHSILKSESYRFLDIAGKIMFPTDNQVTDDERKFYEESWGKIELVANEALNEVAQGGDIESIHAVLEKYK